MKDDLCAPCLGFPGRGILSIAVMLLVTTSLASPPASLPASPAAPADHLPPSRGNNAALEQQARDEYFDALDHRGRPFGTWPFDGFIEAPTPFPRAVQPRPIATVEWRQKDGRLHESHATGNTEGLRICRALRPTLVGEERLAENSWRPPESEMGRGSWSTGFVDCYEVAEGGPWVTLSHRGDRMTLEAHLVGFSETGAGVRSVGNPVPSWCVEQSNAMQGPLFERGDFDDNGSMDFIIGSFQNTLGLALNQQSGWIVLTDAEGRRAEVEPIETIGTNLVDLDSDGSAEILVRDFDGTMCLDDRPHNFYITQCLGIENLRLVDLQGRHRFRNADFLGEFPSFEWLAFNPRSRFKPLLSPEMKASLIKRRYPTPGEGMPAGNAEDRRPPAIVRTFSTGHAWREIERVNDFTVNGVDVQASHIALQLVDSDGREVALHDHARNYSAQTGVALDHLTPEDIDGDGLLETAIGDWGAGTQCSSTYTIYRLHPDAEVEAIATWDGFCDVMFMDIGNDGTINAVAQKHFRYVFACGACSNPYARTVERLEGDQWVLDPQAMKAPPPTSERLNALKKKIREASWSPSIIGPDSAYIYTEALGRLWEEMVPLIYSGNGAVAIDLFRETWPPDLPGRQENLEYFLKQLGSVTTKGGPIDSIQDPPIDWPIDGSD